MRQLIPVVALFVGLCGFIAFDPAGVRDTPAAIQPHAPGEIRSKPKPTARRTAPPPGEKTPGYGIGRDGGVWIDRDELMSRPMSGDAWRYLLTTAQRDPGRPDLADQDSKHDTNTLAAALVYARTGERAYYERARTGILAAIGTEFRDGTRWLAISRNLMAYVIAADLLGLRDDGKPDSDGTRVEAWIRGWLTKELPDNNNADARRPMRPFGSGSNAEAQEGACFTAVAAYLDDRPALQRAWDAFGTFSCDPDAPDREKIDLRGGIEAGWAADNSRPCAVNPKGAEKRAASGGLYKVDGAIINDMRRGGPFQWTPRFTQYPWTGLAGYVPAAVILQHAGYPAFQAGDRAVLRAVDYLWFLRTQSGQAAWFDSRRGSEVVQLVNYFYDTIYPVNHPVQTGHTIGYTDWTHPTGDGQTR